MQGVIHTTLRLRAARLVVALIVLGIVLGAGFAPAKSYAAPLPDAPFCDLSPLPPDGSTEVTLICIPPAGWNGSLVVYAHGYVDPLEPLALPAELNLFLPNGTLNPASIPAGLLSQGYAFATTSYEKNGQAVEQGGRNIDALVVAVKQKVAPLPIKRVYLVGASYGALISTMLVERDPKTYNGGALAMCGPLAGTPYEIQYLGDFATVFNYYFSGAAAALANPPADKTPADIISEAFGANPLAAQDLFNVTGAAVDWSQPATAVSTALQALNYSSSARLLDLQTTAGGNPYGNWRTRYRGFLDNRALNAGVFRVRADRVAERYVRRFYTPSGDIERPIVLLHNKLDPVVPYRNELIYAKLVREEGNARKLTILDARNPYGHCNFDPDEIINAFNVLVAKSLEGHHH